MSLSPVVSRNNRCSRQCLRRALPLFARGWRFPSLWWDFPRSSSASRRRRLGRQSCDSLSTCLSCPNRWPWHCPSSRRRPNGEPSYCRSSFSRRRRRRRSTSLTMATNSLSPRRLRRWSQPTGDLRARPRPTRWYPWSSTERIDSSIYYSTVPD